MDTVRIGVIGIGNMGSVHAAQLFAGRVKHAVLTAVCDCDGERLSWAREHFGGSIHKYFDYHQLLCSGEIDAVIIATPHILHPVIAIEAFEQGVHVLTEKPSGIDVQSVREMNKAAEDSGKVLCVMFNQRTNMLYSKLRQLVRDGRLGDIKRFVWIINNWYRTQAYYDSGAWRATWNGEGGGVLLNQCPHNLDIWQWMIGMPKRVRAFCNAGHFHHVNVEDDATIYAEYPNGASAVFITSTGECPGTNRLEISGTKGKAVIEKGALQLWLLDEDERVICAHSPESMPAEKLTHYVIRQTEQETGHLGIMQNFVDAILFQSPLLAPGAEGIKGLEISNAAYLSWWTDSWVQLPVDGELYRKLLRERQEKETDVHVCGKKEPAGQDYLERWKVRW